MSGSPETMSSTPASRPRQRRAVRREKTSTKTGLSCRRCQKRKIRCNGELPRCQNCAKVGVNCQDGESLKCRPLPRAYVNSLCDRIEWLESVVRARCPDVNLERDGPPVADAPLNRDDTEPGCENTQNSISSDQPMRKELLTRPDLTLSAHVKDMSQHGEPVTADVDVQATIINTSVIPSSVGLSHEIGLVSLGANRDPRYIGPSSGYVLCKLMLAASSRTGKITRASDSSTSSIAPYLGELAAETQGPISVSRGQAVNLCQTYFDIIHVQYPFLHQPDFLRSLDRFFEEGTQNYIVGFQVYMVLAISATIVSRLHKIPLSADRYYLAAMQYFEKIQIESSIKGLQCLLLLLILTMHSPSIRLDVWCLNYQCIALVLDLGLQRAVTTSSGISRLDQEMRTRIFWVVYALDRAIATMMGRPIGLRDEACDLRMPADLSDADVENEAGLSTGRATLTHMSYAIHLFKLAKINSEIKYVANSVNPDVPNYAYPGVIDIGAWQKDVLERLDQWAADVPAARGTNDYTRTILLLRYHSMRMLLLRPSPNIPRPDQEALRNCYCSSEESIRLFHELYKKNLLVHNWITFHNIVLSTITMFYCIFLVPSVATTLEIDVFTSNVRASLSVLSAVGEHWSGAKRSRDILDELADPISRWLMEKRRGEELGSLRQPATDGVATNQDNLGSPTIQTDTIDSTAWPPPWSPFDSTFDGQLLSEQYGSTPCANFDSIVLSLFDDFNPMMPSFT
ncbi:hypothetical protein F5Y19DRAFT_435600 [Xylariaceae sp. FL1651]|nr:hypothetical protein F5Y19DRAFT_435600 [Xylariaceae sp. FL1651]